MQDSKTKGTPLRAELLGELLDKPLEDEVAILEALTAALAKGQPYTEIWLKLQDAATRDERIAELALAFEKVLGDRRMKLFPTAAQAGALMHAARFFVDRVGDPDGARGYLERALALNPTHAEAAEMLEVVLVELGDRAGLSQLLAGQAAHKQDLGEQADLLRRALKLLDGLEGQDDKAIKIGLSLLKLEPGDPTTISALEQRLGDAGKWADLAKLLEQALSASKGEEEAASSVGTRRRLLEIYATKTNEIERATPHLEIVLEADPADELALSVAEKLLGHRASAMRVAAALERAYERTGDDAAVARMLGLQLEQNRGGPRRLELQKRLATLQATRLGDPEAAWPVLEQVVVADPADGPMRKLLRQTADLLGKQQDAAKLLTRAATLAKEPLAKALVTVEAAKLLAALGDGKRAAQQIAQVLDTSPDAAAQLEAARALADLPEGVSAAQLATALETIADGAEEREEREEAAERLATVAEYELEDLGRAIEGWRRLLSAGAEREVAARDALERLYEATGRHADLVAALTARAELEAEPFAARAMLLRAARVVSERMADPVEAISLLRRIGERFGPARDLHDLLIPLLTGQAAFAELATVLTSEIELATPPERPELWVELGRIRLAELGDMAGALEAHRAAIEIEPSNAEARAALEAMLDTELGLTAAVVLEPIYRRFGDDAGLVRALEVRLSASVHREERATLLADLIDLTRAEEPGRALSFAGAALALELERRPPDEEGILDRLVACETIADAGPGASALAAELSAALGDGPVQGPAASRVARRAAAAFDASGRAEAAVTMARRAVAAAPEDPDAEALLDELLASGGDGRGRVAACEEAVLRAGGGPRRRHALLRLGAVAEEVGEVDKAVDALERIWSESPGDREALGALLRIHEQAARWQELSGALERARDLEAEGSETRRKVERKLADTLVRAGQLDAAATLYRALVDADDALPDAALGAAFALADRADRPELAAAVLTRRVARARDEGEASRHAEALAELIRDRIGDRPRAAEAFRMAARAAEEDARAEVLWTRLSECAPDDREAAQRLVELRSAAGSWAGALAAGATLLRTAEDGEPALSAALDLEDLAAEAGQPDVFLEAADAALARADGADPARVFDLRLARARTLAGSPARAEEASLALRAAVTGAPDEETRARAVEELGRFVVTRLAEPARREDARAWFRWKADLESEDERLGTLVSWARAEADEFGDREAAIALADRIAEEFPGARAPRELRAEWLLDVGDVERGVEALLELRVEAEGDARAQIERRAAELLLDRRRPVEAVGLLESRLDDDPDDAAALALALRAASEPAALDAAAAVVERAVAAHPAERRASALEALLAAAPNSPRRRGWLEDLLGCTEGERAALVALRLAEESPGEDEAWDRAESLARETGKAEPLAASYRRALDRLASEAAAGGALDLDAVERLGRRAVDWQEEWFDDQDRVCGLLLATLRAVPEAVWAFERLKLAYNAAERWDDLFELYDLVLARTTDPTERVMLLDDAAQAARDFAQDGDRAIQYLEELSKLRPDDARVAGSLERLYERYGRWRDLIALLWGRVEVLPADEAAKLAARVATMWIDGARDGAQALVAIERIERLDPTADGVEALLSRVLEISPAADGDDASCPRQEAARRLEARHRAAGADAALAQVLAVQLEIAEGAGRARLLRELTALRRDRLGDDEGATSALIELVRLEPADAAHREALSAIAERTGRWDRLADALERIAADAAGGARLTLLEEAATLHEERAGAPLRSVALLRVVVDEAEAAKAGPVAARAARALDRLLGQLGDAAARCDVLERRAQLEPALPDRAAALAEAARIAQDDLADRGRAVALARRRIELTAGYPALAEGALDVVVEGLRALGRHEELVLALRERAAAASDARARADRVEAARVLAHPLGRPDHALAAWREVEAAHGRDEEVAEALASLLAETGATEELAKLFEDEAARATDPRRAATFLVRLGELRRAEGAFEDALASYRLALETDPACEAAADGLRALVSAPTLDRAVLRDVVSALEASYRAAESWEALVALTSARLGVAPDDVERRAILLETAKVLEGRLFDDAGAAERVADALALDPSAKDAADELLRLSRAADDFSAAARVLAGGAEARLLASAPGPTAVELLRGAAARAEATGDTTAAERFAASGLSRAPVDVDLLERLVRARRGPGGSPLVDALERLARTTGRLEVHRDAVEAARDAEDDRARSLCRDLLDAAGAAWRAAPEDREAREAAVWAFETLAELAREAGDTAEVRSTYLRAAALPFEPARQRELSLAAAALASDEEASSILETLFAADPTDDEVAARLDEVLRRRGERPALRSLWQRRADAAESEGDRAAHRRELAELAMEDGEEAFAIVTLRKSVEESSDPASFSRLVEILSASKRFPELCGALEEHATRLAKRGESARAAKLWERAAEVSEISLRSIERAIQARERALGLADDRAGREALVRLYEQRGHWGKAAKNLEVLLADALADEVDVLTVRLVDALSRAGDLTRARQILEASAGDAPAGSPLRTRLADFYREADLPAPLAELLRQDAEAAVDVATRVALLREAAALHIQRLDDPAGALPLLARAAELDPDDQGTRLVLAEAMRTAGRLEEAAEVLEGLLAPYGNRRPKERAVIHFELARLHLVRGDRARALEELDQASKIDPAHPEILHAFATLALEEGQLLKAQRTFRGLLFVLKPGRALDARALRGPSRAEVLFELAEIEGRNKEVARQSEMIESAFEAAESAPWEAERLAARLRQAGRSDLLARALRARLAGDLEPAVAAPLVAELAETLAQSAERDEAADEALRAISLAPVDEAVHRRAAKVLAAVDALSRYRAALDASVEESAADLDRVLFVARALERELGDDQAAIAALRRADELLGDAEVSEESALRRLEVSRALEKLVARSGDRASLLAVLQARLEPPVEAVLGDEERVACLRQVIELELETGAEEDAVATSCERLVELAPDDVALEADLRRASDERPKSGRIARLLEDFGRSRERPAVLADALVRLASLEASPGELLREAWEVASAAGDEARTAAILELAVAAAPGAEDPAGEEQLSWALLALAELRAAAGDLARAAELWERAAVVADGEAARDLALRAARTIDESLGDARRAAGIYERLREREPADRAVWGPLCNCYRRLGDRDALARTIEDTLPLVDDLGARNELRLELSTLVRTSDPTRAIALLEEILDEDPGRWDAAAELETLLAAASRKADLAALLGRRLDAARDLEDKARVVDIALRLGALHEELGDDQEATTAYLAGLEWEADHRGILRALVRLAEKREDPMELADALENLMRVETGAAAVEVAKRLASVREGQGDEPGAHAALLAALRAAPEDTQLFAEAKARFEAKGDARALAEALAMGGRAAATPDEQKKSLLEAAAALRDKAGDVPASVELVSQAFDLDPTDRDVLFQLMDARSSLGQHALAIAAVDKALAADPEGDPWLYFSRAVLREGLGDGDGALADLEIAYDRSGGAYAAELEAQVRTCVARADEQGDPAAGSVLRTRLARLQVAAKDLPAAAATLEEVMQIGIVAPEALRLSAEVHEGLGRWADAAEAWRGLLAGEDGEAGLETSLRFADAAVRAERPAEARAALERALSARPDAKAVRDRLRALYDRLGDRRALAQLELREAELVADPTQRAGCLARGARALLELGEAPDVVLAAAAQAAELMPADQDVAVLLAEALSRASRKAEAAVVLERAIQAHKGRRSPRLAQLHRTASRLALEAGEPARALEALGRAFDCDPQNAALALELGGLAVQLGELEIAGRAYRSVTLMRPPAPAAPRASMPPPGPGGRAPAPVIEGASPQEKAIAYYQLGCLAHAQRDLRRAKLMLEKALDEDPTFGAAKEMLAGL